MDSAGALIMALIADSKKHKDSKKLRHHLLPDPSKAAPVLDKVIHPHPPAAGPGGLNVAVAQATKTPVVSDHL